MHTSRNSRFGLTAQADARIPFPYSPTPTACRTQPQTFAYERSISSDPEVRARIARAKTTCRRCPIAAACLQWALAAATASERTGLRHRLIARLGKDWVAVVADRRRVEGATH
ncbi:WhiB family transcriptional regulator [Streptomyces sp. NPDC056309]|uniref:WhiB family transcriptional regulator n=1 Tax=unclassified Streptomyces TaxID=2593676 RepID=UPI0035D87074